MNERKMFRRVSVVIGLAAVAAAMLVSGGSAGTTTKPYTANLCLLVQLVGSACPEGVSPTPALPAGSSDVYLTFRNKANPQSLGSANIGVPSGPSLSYTAAQITSGAGNATVDSPSLVKLRNLNLPPNGSVTVKLTVNTPVCTTGNYNWGAAGVIVVKQSNDFNGPPGNDFTRVAPSDLTATLSGGGCHLAIVPDDPAVLDHQPKDTAPNQPITDGFLSTGGPIQVGLYDSSHSLVPVDGTCPGFGCVTASLPASLGGDTTQALNDGIASFGDLTLATPGDYTITFTSGTLSTTTATFSIVNDGCTVTSGGTCSVDGVFLKTGNTPTTTADASATFVGAGGLSLKFFLQGTTPTGCQNFIGTGSAGVDTHVEGSTTGFSITYGVSDKALKAAYGPNFGQPNVPICVGAQRRVDGDLVPCGSDTAGGWTGRTLGPDGKPDGGFDQATCGSDGLWWNIAPTFQDTLPAGSPLPPISIVITGWGSATATDGTALRTFTIFKPPPWDSRCIT